MQHCLVSTPYLGLIGGLGLGIPHPCPHPPATGSPTRFQVFSVFDILCPSPADNNPESYSQLCPHPRELLGCCTKPTLRTLPSPISPLTSPPPDAEHNKMLSILSALRFAEEEPRILLRGARHMDEVDPISPIWLFLGVVSVAAAYKLYTWLQSGRPSLQNADEVIARLSSADREKIKAGEISSIEAPCFAQINASRTVLDAALRQLQNTATAAKVIAALRSEKYDRENPHHESLLTRLWKALKPGVTLSKRISDDWEELGFQGKDPATDFRGNGVLGLANLVYFAENHGAFARKMMSEGGFTEERSQTMQWYMLAVTGINLTSPIAAMVASGEVDRFLKGDVPATVQPDDVLGHPSIILHSQLYSTLMMQFHNLWMKQKPAIAHFETFVKNEVLPTLPAASITRA